MHVRCVSQIFKKFQLFIVSISMKFSNGFKPGSTKTLFIPQLIQFDEHTINNNNNNNNNNITSMALKSSEARAQKRNKTKSVIKFKSRGHTGVIISFKGPPTI